MDVDEYINGLEVSLEKDVEEAVRRYGLPTVLGDPEKYTGLQSYELKGFLSRLKLYPRKGTCTHGEQKEQLQQ